MAVLDPIKLKLTNWEHCFTSRTEPCHAPVHPHHPEMGQRRFDLTSELWIEREDFLEEPTKGYQRLYPGNMAHSKYGCRS